MSAEGRPNETVLAIDAGYRNFAWCLVAGDGIHQPMAWCVEDILPAKVKADTDTLAEATRAWCVRHKLMLDNVDHVVLEKQMRSHFHVINAVIQTQVAPGKTTYYHPSTVGAFWQLPRKREQKKPAGVRVVKANVQNMPTTWTSKQDDLADAWLLGVFHLQRIRSVAKTHLIFLAQATAKGALRK